MEVPAGHGPPPGRRVDYVFDLVEPEHGESGPRVAGTNGVTVPEIAPESAEEAARIEQLPRAGWVVLRVLVLRDGSAGEVEAAPGGDDGAAATLVPAVKRLRFRPALERGRPVDAWYTMVWPPK